MIVDKLNYCKKCINRKSNLNEGLVCGLTGRKPNFGDTCKDFKEDKTRIKNEASLKKAKSTIKSKTSTWTVLAIAVSIVLIGLRMVRLISKFQEKNNASEQYYSDYQETLEKFKNQSERQRKRKSRQLEKERYHINTVNYIKQSNSDVYFSKQLVQDTSLFLNDYIKIIVPKRFRLTLANENSDLPLFANTKKYYLAVNKLKKETDLRQSGKTQDRF